MEYLIILAAVLLVMAFTMGQHKKSLLFIKIVISTKIPKSAIKFPKMQYLLKSEKLSDIFLL